MQSKRRETRLIIGKLHRLDCRHCRRLGSPRRRGGYAPNLASWRVKVAGPSIDRVAGQAISGSVSRAPRAAGALRNSGLRVAVWSDGPARPMAAARGQNGEASPISTRPLQRCYRIAKRTGHGGARPRACRTPGRSASVSGAGCAMRQDVSMTIHREGHLDAPVQQ